MPAGSAGVDDAAAARALHAECVRRRDEGLLAAVDIVPAARTVLLEGVSAALVEEIPGWDVPALPAEEAAPVVLPVTFDGPDLAEVARQWEVSVEAVPRIVLAAELRVDFCGFAPGFAYLSGLGRPVARRESPRTAVPAGAVALAGEYAGVYPARSPGGWQLIGVTAARVWDADRDPAALLAPGAPVRFVEAP